MLVLIDADIVAYRCSASAENETEYEAVLRTDKLMRSITEETQSTSYISFLSGEGNFRKEINLDYKAHRKDMVKPCHLKVCRDYLVQAWSSEICNGYEADDALGFNQTEYSVIATIDKDLLMIPGKHYNFVTREFQEVDELSGLQHFYKQLLIGDKADNIRGVDGIGKVKAAKLINHLLDEKDMYNTVCKLYNDPDRLEMNADCLWIWRKLGERWGDRFDIR